MREERKQGRRNQKGQCVQQKDHAKETDRGPPLFDKVAVAVAEVRPEETPEQLWKPILDLGAPAHYWISSFLGGWFIHGPKAAASLATFADRWREMIDHALASTRWSASNPRLGFRLADLMIELMGLSGRSHSIGEAEYASVIESLRPQFRAFATQWLHVPRVASSFAAFLAQPSGRGLVADGVLWLDAALSRYERYDWREDQLAENLVDALRSCWLSARAEIQRRNDVRAAFLRLLGQLVGRQNAAAMELRDEVTRGMNE